MMNDLRIALTILAAFAFTSTSHALGFELGESKEELKLDYTVTVYDHQNDHVTVVFTLKDEGRMKPLFSVDLNVPNEKGSGSPRIVAPLKLSGEGEAKTVRLHLHKDLFKNASISLKTRNLAGKSGMRTWYYHLVSLQKSDGTAKPNLPTAR